jgi:hypothetical protein
MLYNKQAEKNIQWFNKGMPRATVQDLNVIAMYNN